MFKTSGKNAYEQRNQKSVTQLGRFIFLTRNWTTLYKYAAFSITVRGQQIVLQSLRW